MECMNFLLSLFVSTVVYAATTTAPIATTTEGMVRREFQSDAPVMVQVAFCESTFRQYGPDGDVLRGSVNPQDRGIFQINEKYHGDEAAALGFDIYTTEGNIEFGRYLYSKYGTQPWQASEPCWDTDIHSDLTLRQ